LTHKLDEFGISGFALVKTVFIFGEKLLESASTILLEHLVDFALSNSVLVTTEKLN
jgi:hypothetical protein